MHTTHDHGDGSYRPKSRTPLSESFSHYEDHHYKRRSKSPSCEGVGNDGAINQISESPFTRRIEGGKASLAVYSTNIHRV